MNPYDPPQQTEASMDIGQDLEVYRRMLDYPSAWIILLALVSSCVDVSGIASDVFSPSRSRVPLPGVPAWSVLLMLHATQFLGGLQMRKIGHYQLACISTITCCIPCISPLGVLGIPFGVWSLSVLLREDTRNAWRIRRSSCR